MSRPIARRELPEPEERGGPEASWTERLARLQGDRLYRAVGLAFLLALLLLYLDAIARTLLIGFVGAILAVAFDRIIRRLPVGRKLGTVFVALLTLGVLAGGAWFAVTFLVGQFQQLLAALPPPGELIDSIESWVDERIGLEIEILGAEGRAVLERLLGGTGGLAILTGAFGLVELAAMVILVLVGAFFLVARPDDQLLIPLLRAVPPHKRDTARRLLGRLGERLGGWLFGTAISMIAVGILAVIAFMILGVPYALLLGVLVGLADVIPLVGPWVGGAVAVLVTLIQDPGLALWVAVAVLVIQEIESNLVRPFVMSEAAKLHPFVTLLALILFTSMFGLLGAILSLPIALALGSFVEVLWVEDALDAGDHEIGAVVDRNG